LTDEKKIIEGEMIYHRKLKAKAETFYTKADEYSIPLLVDLILTEKLNRISKFF